MNIEAIKIRLAELEAGRLADPDHIPPIPAVAGIAGVKRAYAQAPASLPEADLPVFCNFAGQTTAFEEIGSLIFRESRIFRCVLYVVQIQQGLDGQAEAEVEPYIPLGQEMFLNHPSGGNGNIDELITGVESLEYVGDGGIGVFTFAKTMYIGVEFRVQVTAIVKSVPAPFE